jgi:hypothetical protein
MLRIVETLLRSHLELRCVAVKITAVLILDLSERQNM